jgi:hypothetical protein
LVLHAGAHAPALQLVLPCAFEQATAQSPQCATLLASVTSQPVLGSASQSAYPPLQPATAQALFRHCGVPFAAMQTLPQKLQLLSELVRSVSQPTVVSPSHSALPAGQVEAMQLPPLQICEPA